MEKQHLKRLGYGFSALVMALSAVNFVPTSAAYAVDGDTSAGEEAEETPAENGVKFINDVILMPLYKEDGETLNSMRIDDPSIVQISGEGWEIKASGKDGDAITRNTATAESAKVLNAAKVGFKVYTITVTKGGQEHKNDVTFYVYNTALSTTFDEEKAEYVEVGGRLNIKHPKKANPNSVITYSYNGVEKEGTGSNNWYYFYPTKVGEQVITVTETLAGQAIRTQNVPVVVYGVETLPATVEFFAGQTYELPLAMHGVAIKDIIKSRNLNFVDDSNDTITSDVKGEEYDLTYKFEYTDEYSEALSVEAGDDYKTLTIRVKVYEPFAINSEEEITIDIADEDGDGTATVELTAYKDEAIKATIVAVGDTEDAEVSIEQDGEAEPDEDNKYTFTFKALDGKLGANKVTFTQTINDAVCKKTVTINVVDSSVVDPTPEQPEDEVRTIEKFVKAGDRITVEAEDLDDVEYDEDVFYTYDNDDGTFTFTTWQPGVYTITVNSEERAVEYKVTVVAVYGPAQDTVFNALAAVANADDDEARAAAEAEAKAVLGEETYEGVLAAVEAGEYIYSDIFEEEVSDDAQDAIANELGEGYEVNYYRIKLYTEREYIGNINQLTADGDFYLYTSADVEVGYKREYKLFGYVVDENGNVRVEEIEFDLHTYDGLGAQALTLARIATTNEINFTSNYAHYALAYADVFTGVETPVEAPNKPDAGHSTAETSATSASLSVVAAVMAAITAAGAALFAKRK